MFDLFSMDIIMCRCYFQPKKNPAEFLEIENILKIDTIYGIQMRSFIKDVMDQDFENGY